MKKALLLSSITVLTIGTIALVVGQDPPASEVPDKVPEIQSTDSEEAVKPAARPAVGIRSDDVILKQLPGSDDPAITIPVASVFAEGDSYFVLVSDADFRDDFRQVEVSLGRTDGNLVEVSDGLSAGDRVLTVTMSQLRFPAFGDEVFAKNGESCARPCEGDSCKASGKICDSKGCKPSQEKCKNDTQCTRASACERTCETPTSFGFTLSAREFFDSAFCDAPGPVMMAAPGFFAPF